MKRLFCAALALFLLCSLFPAAPSALAQEDRIEAAIAWAVATAEDDTHGYSGCRRLGPEYDCSAFVSTALMEGGFPLESCFSSSSAASVLEGLGFVRYRRGEITPRRGDILVLPGVHVELCLGDGRCVAAHRNYDGCPGDSSGREIEVRCEEDCPFCRFAQYRWILRYQLDKPSDALEDDLPQPA